MEIYRLNKTTNKISPMEVGEMAADAALKNNHVKNGGVWMDKDYFEKHFKPEEEVKPNNKNKDGGITKNPRRVKPVRGTTEAIDGNSEAENREVSDRSSGDTED